MTLTPGAYLKLRRTAAALSVADVAAQVWTEPHTAEHLRREWLEAIEADLSSVSFSTIVTLHRTYPFSLDVLERLEAISHQGELLPAPRLCRICGCSKHDACMIDGFGCGWAAEDLCTRCEQPQPEAHAS